MVDDGKEETLELSLVDGITCGLASALLLLIIFGMNMAMPTMSLGGASGHGTFGKRETGLTAEPVDLVVEVTGPAEVINEASGFVVPLSDQRKNNDRTMKDIPTRRSDGGCG